VERKFQATAHTLFDIMLRSISRFICPLISNDTENLKSAITGILLIVKKLDVTSDKVKAALYNFT
jgi:hypothetical protein